MDSPVALIFPDEVVPGTQLFGLIAVPHDGPRAKPSGPCRVPPRIFSFSKCSATLPTRGSTSTNSKSDSPVRSAATIIPPQCSHSEVDPVISPCLLCSLPSSYPSFLRSRAHNSTTPLPEYLATNSVNLLGPLSVQQQQQTFASCRREESSSHKHAVGSEAPQCGTRHPEFFHLRCASNQAASWPSRLREQQRRRGLSRRRGM